MRNGPTQPLQPNLSRMLRRASRAHEQGEFDKAERLYTAALHIHPDNFDALHGLGLINYRRGRLDAALALIQAALKADLDRADGFSSLGLVFHALKQFERALKSYDEGLRLAPGDIELLNRRGVALLELGRPREALDNFERVLAADPDHLDALGNRGNALIKLNRPAEALSSYDRALTIAPDNAQLLTNRAAALRRLDRPHEAVMSARRALVSRPDFAQAKFVEGVARLTLGDFSGWRGYEARWGVGFLAAHRRSFAAPLWLGEYIARRQDHSAARRAGFWRHAAVRALRAAGGRPRRQCHSRSPARARPAVVAAAGRRRGGRARQTFAAFRLSLSADEPAAGFCYGAGNDPGANPLRRAGGSRRRAVA